MFIIYQYIRNHFTKTWVLNLGTFPVAEKYYEQAISLPIFPSLQYEDLSRITDILKEFLS